MGLRVIVTGAGGPAGVAVIRAMARSGVDVIAADADPLAVGLRLGRSYEVLPRADAPSFVEAVCDAAARTDADALVSTVAEELLVLGPYEARLNQAGVKTWFPNPLAVERCLDKWHFAVAMQAARVAVPATGLGSAAGVPGPWIVKPRFGRGSRDVYATADRAELDMLIKRVPDPLVQTKVTGREFTVDAMTTRDGALAGAVPRWRLETKAGISTKGVTFTDEALVSDVSRILELVGLEGPANVQGFIDDDGCPWFIEVNPRFSGGLPLSLAAGTDLVGEYLRGVLGQPVRPDRLKPRPGVMMLRHYVEVFEG